MEIGVIGAGVTGLATASELSKIGHRVTIIERDETPMPNTCEEAFFGIVVAHRKLGIPTRF